MKKILIAFTLLIIIAVTGCTVGNELIVDRSIISQIKENVSTKSDVRGLLGNPEDQKYNQRGNETWRYRYGKIPICCLMCGSYESHDLMITFNKNGIVTHQKHKSQGGGK